MTRRCKYRLKRADRINMFGRLQSLVSNAVDALTAPAAASATANQQLSNPDEDLAQFRQHWRYVQAVYHQPRRGTLRF